MAKYTVVISEDALLYDDMEYLCSLPAFSSVLPQSARVHRMRSIYPTITYPCHTTMSTGCYPDRHGVLNNEQTILGEVSSLWEHFHHIVKVPDLFDLAKAAGLRTASVFWPVTGGHPHIDYLVNEYWPQHGEDEVECHLDSGSSPETMEVIRNNAHFNRGRQRQHPWNDQFINGCACEIMRRFTPNLLMVHLGNLDGYRHQAGMRSMKAVQGLHEIDLWLSDMLQALDIAGIRDETNLFIVSDHGQMDVRGSIHPNVLLVRAGLIQLDEAGDIADYKAIAKSTGASCQIYLKDPENREVWNKTKEVLEAACREGVYGIERVYTREETARLERLSGPFSFVLEMNGLFSFGNEWTEPPVRAVDCSDYKLAHATHGYHPDKGPQPTLLAFGPDIRPGALLEQAGIVDIAPTVAHSLGLSMPGVDGRVLTELFR
ncbi:MAG: alkaline phosphatase family protein [Clostridiales bacterium]|nr:alkaline phosphatase family protein [Bacillota bacterium]NLL55280.1 alkaline phosphatase family protein [Clostridiales bacterium]